MFASSFAWLDLHSGAVQALCGVLGLVGLAIYTFLTYGIRKESMRQALGAQRPLLVFDNLNDNGHWRLLNRGVGPALRVRWKVGKMNHPGNWHNIGAIAVDDWSDLSSEESGALLSMPDTGLRVHYEDLSGNSFCSTVGDSGDSITQDCFGIRRRERFDLDG